jgi:hypothetical protein
MNWQVANHRVNLPNKIGVSIMNMVMSHCCGGLSHALHGEYTYHASMWNQRDHPSKYRLGIRVGFCGIITNMLCLERELKALSYCYVD